MQALAENEVESCTPKMWIYQTGAAVQTWCVAHTAVALSMQSPLTCTENTNIRLSLLISPWGSNDPPTSGQVNSACAALIGGVVSVTQPSLLTHEAAAPIRSDLLPSLTEPGSFVLGWISMQHVELHPFWMNPTAAPGRVRARNSSEIMKHDFIFPMESLIELEIGFLGPDVRHVMRRGPVRDAASNGG